MGDFNIKVTEYGIKKKNKKIYPEHYNWKYCVEKKIPYIIITPKIKYSNIDFDLFTVDNGLSFPDNHKFVDYWWNIYEEYIKEVSLPKKRIPLRIIGEVTDSFVIYKADQDRIIKRLMDEIESFTNRYAFLDKKRKEHFEEIRKHNEKYG
jgi:hypothetical protein